MAAVISRGDMADMAVEDLRLEEWWDLTEVVFQYNKPTHAAPLVKNAILRYALCSPDADAAAFIKPSGVQSGLVARLKSRWSSNVPHRKQNNDPLPCPITRRLQIPPRSADWLIGAFRPVS